MTTSTSPRIVAAQAETDPALYYRVWIDHTAPQPFPNTHTPTLDRGVADNYLDRLEAAGGAGHLEQAPIGVWKPWTGGLVDPLPDGVWRVVIDACPTSPPALPAAGEGLRTWLPTRLVGTARLPLRTRPYLHHAHAHLRATQARGRGYTTHLEHAALGLWAPLQTATLALTPAQRPTPVVSVRN